MRQHFENDARHLIGHDGALRFWLHDGHTEMFLFKFCGQP
jgi:hypothetical protein